MYGTGVPPPNFPGQSPTTMGQTYQGSGDRRPPLGPPYEQKPTPPLSMAQNGPPSAGAAYNPNPQPAPYSMNTQMGNLNITPHASPRPPAPGIPQGPDGTYGQAPPTGMNQQFPGQAPGHRFYSQPTPGQNFARMGMPPPANMPGQGRYPSAPNDQPPVQNTNMMNVPPGDVRMPGQPNQLSSQKPVNFGMSSGHSIPNAMPAGGPQSPSQRMPPSSTYFPQGVSQSVGPPVRQQYSGMPPPTGGMGAPLSNSGPAPPISGSRPWYNSNQPPSAGVPPSNLQTPSLPHPGSFEQQSRGTAPPPSSMAPPPSNLPYSSPSVNQPPPSSMPPPSNFAPAFSGIGPPRSVGHHPNVGPSQPPVIGQESMQPGHGPPMAGPPPSSMMPPAPMNIARQGHGHHQPPMNMMGRHPSGSDANQQGGYPQGQFVPGQPSPGGQPMGYPNPNTAPQRGRRLNPDQMPSPIQVIEEDRANHNGTYITQAIGTLPPLVTTDFICQDQGNANPRFVRSTMYNVPCTPEMLKTSHMPFALSISPFAKLHLQEASLPLVDFADIGPVRCKRCKAYINPYMLFIDGGRKFQCAFCGVATEVPEPYFNHLDHTGSRVDRYQRAELCLGSYEMVATKDYCRDNVLPQPPAFIFMIDVTYQSVKSGLVHLICAHLKQHLLDYLPKIDGATESEVRVGFVTYGRELHFYNIKSTLAQPQMLVVSDLEDVFVPLLDGFLVKVSESEAIIDSLLSQIPDMFAQSHETNTILGPVIQAGLDALKSAACPGKLFVFHTSLPIAEVPGCLKNRDENKLLGSDKEKIILSPQGKFYTQLGEECVGAGCSVDLFLFPTSYIDVASVSEVCRLTSGNLYKYSFFQADLDGDRFLDDLRFALQKSVAFDAILRVRSSTGIRPVDFYGNFYMSNTTDVELASIDTDESVIVEIKHDDKLTESENAYIQIAVLYTTVAGQRRLRIHNVSFNCCGQLADMYRNCELDTLINYLSKRALRGVLNDNPKSVRETVMTDVAEILACYRKNCTSPQTPEGQLILPESMKLLPLYSNCVLKSDAISGGGGNISTDDRSYMMFLLNSMDVTLSNVFFYPRLIRVTDDETDADHPPEAVRCSTERLVEDEVYVLENGLSMFLWIGLNVRSDWVQNVFGVQSVAQINIEKSSLLELDTVQSKQLRSVVDKMKENRTRHMKLTIVRQRDKLEPWFNHFLVEDKTTGSSYVDFLCHIHKEIQEILR